jgi:hypothetical protein
MTFFMLNLRMGPDLTNRRWIVLKGILFAFLAGFAGVLQIFVEMPIWQKSLFLIVCVWASCRFYYFLFYVLHSYVDPTLKSAGILDLFGQLWRRR